MRWFGQHRDMHDHPATQLRDGPQARNALSSSTTPRNGTARSITPADGAIRVGGGVGCCG